MKPKPLLLSCAAAGVGAALWRKSQYMDLKDRVVLITGGPRGLGLALARKFASEGSRLMLCARSADELGLAKQDLSKLHAEVHTATCDVSDRKQVDHLIAETIRRYGCIDVLVNNAGIIQVGPVHTMSIEDFEKAMGIMFWGMVYTTLAVLPHMREHRQGRVVN